MRPRLAVPAAPVDLGGIGKGLALRWAAAGLVAEALTDFLLEAGGDRRRSGRLGGEPWFVGIEDPAGGDDLARHHRRETAWPRRPRSR